MHVSMHMNRKIEKLPDPATKGIRKQCFCHFMRSFFVTSAAGKCIFFLPNNIKGPSRAKLLAVIMELSSKVPAEFANNVGKCPGHGGSLILHSFFTFRNIHDPRSDTHYNSGERNGSRRVKNWYRIKYFNAIKYFSFQNIF